MQKNAPKIAIFLKIAKNHGHDFPDGQVHTSESKVTKILTFFTMVPLTFINFPTNHNTARICISQLQKPTLREGDRF